MTKRYSVSSRTLYYLAVALYVLANNIQLSYAYTSWVTSGSKMITVLQLLRYISYGLCFARLMHLRRFNQAFLWIGAVFLCGSIIAAMTGTANSPIFYLLFFVAGINTDFKTIVKIFLTIQLFTFILYLFCGLTGITGEETIEQTGRTRAFLGYGWVNRASYCLLFMTIELLYLSDFKLRIMPAMAIMIANIVIYYLTRTFFSMAITIIIVFAGLMYKYFRFSKRGCFFLNEKRLTFFYVLTIIISLLLPLLYKPGHAIWEIINKAVTGRLALSQEAIQRYGLHIWGNKVEWVGSSTLLFGLSESKEYFYVDAGFLNLALEFGLLFTGVIAYLYLRGIRLACWNRDTAMTMCLFVLFCLYIFEPYVIDFAFNPFPLFFISTIKDYFQRGNKKALIFKDLIV